jgi:ribosomal-protein-alanine N-acetyltransferase
VKIEKTTRLMRVHDRVSIRFVEKGDAPFVQRYASNELISKTCNVPHPYPENGGQEWVDFAIRKMQREESYVFAVLCDGDFAGVISLNAVNKKQGTAELDYWIAVPFWNRGICTAAAAQAIKFAFDDAGLHTLRSGSLKRNPASGRVLEKNGFQLIDEFIIPEGKFKGEKFLRYELVKDAAV